jgi:hypothetical protein
MLSQGMSSEGMPGAAESTQGSMMGDATMGSEGVVPF